MAEELPKPPRQTKKKKEWKDMTKREKFTGMLTLLVLACLIIWGISAAASGGSKSNNNGSALDTANNSSADTSGGTADIPDSSSTGNQPIDNSTASTPAPTPSNSVAAWHAKYGSTLTTLSNDMGTFSSDAEKLDYTAVLNDCQKMNSDATADINLPTIPNTSAAGHYSSGLTYTQTAAQSCINAMNDHFAGNDDQAISELETTNTDISLAGTQFSDTANIINGN